MYISGIKVGNSSKVKDNSFEYRFDYVSFYNCCCVFFVGFWVILRLVVCCNFGVVIILFGYFFGLFDKLVIDIRSVRVEERFFELVDYDVGRRVFNFDIFFRRFFIKGNVDILDVFKGVISFRFDLYMFEEVIFGLSDMKK